MRVVLRTSLALALLPACASSVPLGSADASGDVARDAVSADGAPAPCPVLPLPNDPDLVVTDRGPLRGVRDGDLRVFKGVRYAAPPTGPNRFRAPQPAACLDSVFPATDYGAECPQIATRGASAGAPVGDEDCLTLNVWGPAQRAESGLPVLVFVHGGGNQQGSASVQATTGPIYDGAALARRGAVVVTIQYRLGALGWLVHEALDAESADGTSGNLGLRDQLAALAWVQRNIEQFGGNPARVMVFGESAGGLDVHALLASPRARGLFSVALSESGGASAVSRARAIDAGHRLANALGCTTAAAETVACLRAKTPAEILQALPQTVDGLTANDFGPSVDGAVLPATPQEIFAAGTHNRVPFVLGTNSEETAAFVTPASITTDAQYQAAARALLASYGLGASQSTAVLALYPSSGYASPWAAMVALSTDVRWTCPQRGVARTIAASGSPVYRYFFARGLDPTRAPVASRLGAYHGLELFYVFGAFSATGYRPTAEDVQVSDAMQSAWVSFASSGTPTPTGSTWPAYVGTTDPYFQFGAQLGPSQGLRTDRCDALERIARTP